MWFDYAIRGRLHKVALTHSADDDGVPFHTLLDKFVCHSVGHAQ